MAHQINLASPEDRRENHRKDVVLWGRVRLGNGDAHPARICNLSAGGFMAMTPVAMRRYAEMELEIPVLGWKPAHIAWIDGDRLGGEFEPPLDPDVVTRLLAFRQR